MWPDHNSPLSNSAGPSRRSMLAAGAVVAAAGVALAYDAPGAQAQTLSGARTAVPTLYGANVGGWCTGVYGNKETQATAWSRILAGFGAINVVRDWTHGLQPWSNITSAYGTRALIIEVPDTDPTTLGNWLKAAPTDRPIWWCWKHEPEFKTDPATFKATWAKLAAAHRANSPSNVKSTIILMGGSYIPSRYSWVGGHPWSDWYPTDPTALANLDTVGADVYHFGHNDALADTAEFVLRPLIDVGKSLNKRVIIGEYGMVRTASTEWPDSPFWSNSMRVQRITEAIAIFDEPTNRIRAVCAFESDHGAQSNGAPHNLLGPPPGRTESYPSRPGDLWRAASTR
jgi:hypothetical protein